MKYALQIYGVFRTFDLCLPQILNYIHYDHLDYDVFILSQKDDGYSLDNENKICSMLGRNKIVSFKYIDCDYPIEVLNHEDQLCQYYDHCVTDARKQIQNDLITNAFVTRLWYRRWLNNQIRIEYEQKNHIKYDWVIRTRFDIGYSLIASQQKLDLLLNPPKPNVIYLYPDIFSCGSPSVINYESLLINSWPYIYRTFLKNKHLNCLSNDPSIIRKWLFMSELNLVQYLNDSHLTVERLSHDFKIVRYQTKLQILNPNLGSEHMTKIYYGKNSQWIEMTDQFIEKLVTNYDREKKISKLTIDGQLIDQKKQHLLPFDEFNVVVLTMENHEYFYAFKRTIEFKYQYFYHINYKINNFIKVTYGVDYRMIDITKRFILSNKNHMHYTFITNQLANCDPAPGIEKKVRLYLSCSKFLEFPEYAIIVFS